MFCILTAAVFGRSTEIREQPNMSENAILREHLTNVASGDKAAFSELYDLTRTAVYGLALELYEVGSLRAGHHAGHLRPRLGICRAI